MLGVSYQYTDNLTPEFHNLGGSDKSLQPWQIMKLDEGNGSYLVRYVKVDFVPSDRPLNPMAKGPYRANLALARILPLIGSQC